MNKFARYMMMTVLAACFCVPAFGQVEAASVAIMPLINRVEGDELASQVYYKQAIAKLNSQKGFYMEDNDKLTAAIEANTAESVLPTEAQLAAIAKEGDVDIVFAMELNELSKKELPLTKERIAVLKTKGNVVAYNRLNGAFYKHAINGEKRMNVALMSRFDRLHEEFGRIVRLEVERALKAK